MVIQSINFYGLKVSVFNEEDIENYLLNAVKCSQSIICYGYSFFILPQIKDNPEIYFCINDSDLMLADGRPFYFILNLFGAKLKSDISIPRFVLKVLHIANQNKLKILFLGGKKETNKKAIQNIKNKYNYIKEVVGHHGFWKQEEENIILKEIRAYSPDIIFLTLSSPKKEILASKLKNEKIARIIIPCGGMIDVLAGEKILTPILLKKIGFATLFRLVQDRSKFNLTIRTYITAINIVIRLLIAKIFKLKNKVFLDYFGIKYKLKC